MQTHLWQLPTEAAPATGRQQIAAADGAAAVVEAQPVVMLKCIVLQQCSNRGSGGGSGRSSSIHQAYIIEWLDLVSCTEMLCKHTLSKVTCRGASSGGC